MLGLRVEIGLKLGFGKGLAWFIVGVWVGLRSKPQHQIRIGVGFFRVWFKVSVGVRQRCSLVYCSGYMLNTPYPLLFTLTRPSSSYTSVQSQLLQNNNNQSNC